MKKNKHFSILCLILFFMLSCKSFEQKLEETTADFPLIDKYVNAENSKTATYYKTNDGNIISIMPDSIITHDGGKFHAQKGEFFLFTASRHIFSYLENVTVNVSPNMVNGDYARVEVSMPYTSKITHMNVTVTMHYAKNKTHTIRIMMKEYRKNKTEKSFVSLVPFNVFGILIMLPLMCRLFKDDELFEYQGDIPISEGNFKTQVLRFSPAKSTQIMNADRSKYTNEQTKRWELWPVNTGLLYGKEFVEPLKDMTVITSTFGLTREWRLHNGIVHNKDTHLGNDYYAPIGTEIYSASKGKVVFVGEVEYYGKMIIIEHGLGVHLNYCHMNDYNCSEGDFVEAGQVIGFVGMTGSATGPHLHWELRVHGYPVRPDCFRSILENEPAR